nr:hypothetical protein [Tanacetum cinerariifolium]
MEIILEPTSNKLLVGDVGDSIWIELGTLFVLMSHGGEAVMVSNGFEVVAKSEQRAVVAVEYDGGWFYAACAVLTANVAFAAACTVVLNYADVETDNIDVRDRVYAANRGDMETTLHMLDQLKVDVLKETERRWEQVLD